MAGMPGKPKPQPERLRSSEPDSRGGQVHHCTPFESDWLLLVLERDRGDLVLVADRGCGLRLGLR